MLKESSYTSLTQDFVREVCSANGGLQVSVILIGSVARSTHTSQSDLDLLVISDQPPVIDRHPDRLHVQALTTTEFTERLRAGDDFPAWCIRYGVPLVTSNRWLEIVTSVDAGIWPDWRKKVRHAARRLTLATSLLETGDTAAAAEEMLYAVSHTSRAILFKSGIFPLSRPEIISQLRDGSHARLAKLLQDLSYEEPTRSALQRASLYVKRLLVYLDSGVYREFVQSRRQHLLVKEERRARLPKTRNGAGAPSHREAKDGFSAGDALKISPLE